MSRDVEGAIVCDACGILAEYPSAELKEAGWWLLDPPATDDFPEFCAACVEGAERAAWETLKL